MIVNDVTWPLPEDSAAAERQATRTTFRDVFAVAEFRALWVAQLLSVIGDQFARIALTVLVYDRTRLALFAAITFVVTIVPTFVGGITLAWLADRYPRRGVMIGCDLARCALVLAMVAEGVPLAGKVTLLFLVTLIGAPYSAARAAIYPDVLVGDRYVLGTAVTLTTYQFAQVLGFAAGGAVVAFFGTRPSLITDGATFAASALIIRAGVRARRAPAVSVASGHHEAPRLARILTPIRLVWVRWALRTPLLFGLLAAFYSAPEGVVTPLAHAVGGGAAAVGVILAAAELGQTIGAIILSRFVAPPTRLRLMGSLAVAACGFLVLFFWRPSLPVSLLILFASGLCSSYQLAANAAFVSAAPREQRSQVFGVAQGGLSLSQGAVIILAGAAADQRSPALVIAVSGAIGAVAALAISVSWYRKLTHTSRNQRQAAEASTKIWKYLGKRAKKDAASLAVLATPYVLAAAQTYGNAVLAKLDNETSDSPVDLGRQILMRIFGPVAWGEPLPGPVQDLAADPHNEDALVAVRLAIGRILASDSVLADDVRSMLAASAETVSARDRQDINPAVTSDEAIHDTASPPAPPGPAFGPGSDLAQNGRRYLRGQCPENIPVGEPFSLLVSIVLAGPPNTQLKPFSIGPTGSNVLLVLYAPGFRVLSHQRLTVRVPPDANSEPVMFELRADAPGPRSVSLTAWLHGSYLGELVIDITAGHGRPHGEDRDVLAEIATEPIEGAVSLVVRFDPSHNAYRFEFRDEDNPDEVTSNLAYEPGPRVEQLISTLDALAKDRIGYSAAQTRDYLINSGAALWRELVPARLREQFWERQHRIRQLTILADRDVVPWELLYPKDPGHDAGFLVEQFPVTRAIFGHRPARSMRLRPARFVLPEGSPPEAQTEIEELRKLIDLEQPVGSIITALTPLLDLIRGGDFGLLHFACHNNFDPSDGSSITLDERPFTPTLLTTAAIGEALATSAPTVFLNACRSAGLTASYNRLDGWATKFLEAGAAVFIGSLWAVCDSTGREFAEELYRQLRAGESLGHGVMHARRAAADRPGDPTWLAYAVYGDPRATVNER